MPAALPADTAANNTGANPSAGRVVMFDALSGPKGSPLDKDASGNASTGAMSTGIGWGGQMSTININASVNPATSAQAIKNAGFNDDQGPAGAATNSNILYIGGGRSVMSSQFPVAGAAGTNPYTAGFQPCYAGNGGSRDAGAGPAFTGFNAKIVTAAGTVAAAGVVETGFVNRTGGGINTGDSVLGSASAAAAAPS